MYNPVHKEWADVEFRPVFTERPCCGAVASAAADDDVGPLLLGPCGGGARNVVAVVAPAGQKNGRQNGRTFDAGKALAVVVVR